METQGRPSQQDWRRPGPGRRSALPPDPDPEAAREQLEGRVVLVTGAGGSVGAELSRQIADFFPERLFLLDHDPTGLILARSSLGGPFTDVGDDLLLADVRDLGAMTDLLQRARPDVVVHNAALRDRELLERHPREAWLTNVVGTRNVLQAATQAGVGLFVNLTWPAAPTDTVLGRTQLLAERMTARWAKANLGRYLSVRLEEGEASSIPREVVCRLVLGAAAAGVDGSVVGAAPRQLVSS